jgi:hypothetical protein
MAYLGSTPTTQSFIAGTDSFNGTGSATNFTLSRLVNSVNDIQVVVNNVVQYPPNYSVSGTTLTISPAPSSGTNNVYVRYLSTTLQTITPSDLTVSSAKIQTSAVTTAKIADANITAAKLDGAQSGSAPIYAARAWVNFNGTSTVAIRASGNVSSITDNGTGDYTVNFTTSMPDANYSVSNISMRNGSSGASSNGVLAIVFGSTTYADAMKTGSVRIEYKVTTNYEDPLGAFVSIFR